MGQWQKEARHNHNKDLWLDKTECPSPYWSERDVAYFAKRTYIILDREFENTFEMHNVEREMLRTLQRELTSLFVGNQENA